MQKNSFVHHLTKVLIDIMFYGGIVCCIAVPFALPPMAAIFSRYAPDIVKPYTVILLLSGVCALYMVWQMKVIFKTMSGGNPFIPENVTCLRKCCVSSFLIAIIYLIKICFWFTIASSIIVIIFALLGLFSLTLKDLFKQAIAYKEENDWTV